MSHVCLSFVTNSQDPCCTGEVNDKQVDWNVITDFCDMFVSQTCDKEQGSFLYKWSDVPDVLGSLFANVSDGKQYCASGVETSYIEFQCTQSFYLQVWLCFFLAALFRNYLINASSCFFRIKFIVISDAFETSFFRFLVFLNP